MSVKDCSQYDGAMATVVSDGIQSRGALDEGLPSQLQPSRQPAAHSEPVSAEGDHGDDLTVEQEAQQIQEDIAKSKTREGRQWEKREGENEAPPNEMQVKVNICGVHACMHVVCMYVCMYVCICMYVCVYVCMQARSQPARWGGLNLDG